MAYVLGFFTADGSMIKNKRGAHFIEIYIKDRTLLKEIRELFKSNHKIKARKRNGHVAYRLQIGSKEMFNDLLKLGLFPQKSKRINLPNIPKEYFSHFTRGYFDGDGNVWCGFQKKKDRKKATKVLLTRFTSSSRNFLARFGTRLADEIKVSGNPSLLFYLGAYRLSYSAHDSIRLYDFIYSENPKTYLLRKKKIFEKFMDR